MARHGVSRDLQGQQRHSPHAVSPLIPPILSDISCPRATSVYLVPETRESVSLMQGKAGQCLWVTCDLNFNIQFCEVTFRPNVHKVSFIHIKMSFLFLFSFHVLFINTINPKVRLSVAGSFAEISARLLLRAQKGFE